MQTHLADQPVTVVFTPLAEDGGPLQFTAASYRVVDELGTEVIPETTINGLTGVEPEISVDVPALNNALAVGATTGARQVELYLTVDGAKKFFFTVYRLTTNDRLVVPSTSFQTYASAMMLAGDMVGLSSWLAASQEERIAALMEAHRRIARLRYRIEFEDWQSRVVFGSFSTIPGLDQVTLSEWDNLPADFRAAARKAQVYEADMVLSQAGESLEAQREAGVVQRVIGETSVTFRKGKPSNPVLSSRAMSVLSKYLDTRVLIGRG